MGVTFEIMKFSPLFTSERPHLRLESPLFISVRLAFISAPEVRDYALEPCEIALLLLVARPIPRRYIRIVSNKGASEGYGIRMTVVSCTPREVFMTVWLYLAHAAAAASLTCVSACANRFVSESEIIQRGIQKKRGSAYDFALPLD